MRKKNLKLYFTLVLFIAINGVQAQSVKDIDGNVYKTITIGTQTWMAENLRTSKYNDGTPIKLITDSTSWEALTTPAYCWYKNDEKTNKPQYGALYNWFAVRTSRLCPAGWHVPADKEWNILTDHLGGENIAGAKLKEAGASHWKTPNAEANNESGFTALPGGYRSIYGEFLSLGEDGWWWSATEEDAAYAWTLHLYYGYSNAGRYGFSKVPGFSVRCIKD
jgi:uncharacterized protein (TIGR02145 family)